MNPHLTAFEKRISAHRQLLLSHPVYAELKNLDSLRVFMKYHVFAVWDFMSLLKTLQVRLTCIIVPWVPPANPNLARFMNEIVLAEESDEVGNGEYLSHFELYLKAMQEVGADLQPIKNFLGQVSTHADIETILGNSKDTGGVFNFMATTFSLIKGKNHEVAASFLFGREDIIPEMFSILLKELNLLESSQYLRMKQYLERHIEVDGDHHGPLARKMLVTLCGDSVEAWNEAEVAAIASIEARIRLWTFIHGKMTARKHIDNFDVQLSK